MKAPGISVNRNLRNRIASWTFLLVNNFVVTNVGLLKLLKHVLKVGPQEILKWIIVEMF